jgi:hypothetical protein
MASEELNSLSEVPLLQTLDPRTDEPVGGAPNR